MKLLFNLEYRTVFGEQLTLNIVGIDNSETAYTMQTSDGINWMLEQDITAPHHAQALTYYYSVVRGGQILRTEWLQLPHKLQIGSGDCVVFDRWNDNPEDSYLYTSAFTECVSPHPVSKVSKVPGSQASSRMVLMKVHAPQLRQTERLALVGAPTYLGEWNTEKALPMEIHEGCEWQICLDTDRLPISFEYKFIIVRESKQGRETVWENGPNRYFDLHYCLSRSHISLHSNGFAVVAELPQPWFSLAQWKGAGTVIPVFALRTEGSFGVGDFGDLKRIIDWCALTGQSVLQVLPINDTTITHTWQDSYPYNSISIYALHPQYIDLRQLPEIADETEKSRMEQLRRELNALPQIDYERMMEAKVAYLHLTYAQEWSTLKRRATYRQFFDDNCQWLEPYARFCCYRDIYGTADFKQWPKELPLPKKETVEFWYYVQYHLDQQMRQAHDHARKNGIILKGDIPIGISRDGVEAWMEPRYFNLNGQAGAPPDAFAEDGQNWGFPTYNWDEMLADGCSWWVRRFRKMQEYFDAYRIDHVLGFFRIWEIPVPQKSGLYGQFQPSLPLTKEEIAGWGLPFREELYLEDHKRHDAWHPRINALKLDAFKQLGDDERQAFTALYNDYFYRRNNNFWYQEAMKKLPRLTQATRMLVCAEDLGMVPDCVPWVMNDLRILSLEIQSMPKTPGLEFGCLQRNPYRSVATISTHDMSTLRQWWDEDEARTQRYYNNELRREGPAPHPLSGTLAREIVARHLVSPSMLCLLSLQDWLAIDEHLRLPDQNAERINIPANPRHYWRYRMHLNIEQLMQADNLNHEIRLLIRQGGRMLA